MAQGHPMLTLQNHFYNTYAKMLLSHWTVLADYLYQNTLWVKDTLQEKKESALLSDQQINDALNGPLQVFFKSFLSAYAKVAKLESAITLSKEDFFKEAESESDKTLGLSAQLIERTESGALKELRNKLNDLTTNYYTQWDAHIKNCAELLLADFKKMELTLSEIETHDFVTRHPVSELHAMYVDLKVPAPKLPKTDFDFSQYFTAKTVLIIHSALNRMQQPHTEQDITQKIKTLKSTFTTIETAEKELIHAQNNAITQLMQGIA